ncbi:MAG: universal stress protein [Candidatus Electrothrix sp. GW3-4]|uniref:universal stress protein n=1 Tax=Candidatus Electrothrix sp. GW3-4 TaxID=3126740 RepID=UPI0030D007DC
MEKKILAAVDGSVYSSNSLDYLIRLFRQDQNFSVDLFAAVSSSSGDQSWMSDCDIQRTESTAELQRKAKATRYLKDAKERLVRNGFPEENIATFVHASGEGITNSIYHFAEKNLYDGLLIGRRGVGRVGEMLLGSVSADLVRKCHEVPIWIIDGNITSTRFLLAVHTCTHSLMAADHLAFILRNNPKAEIYIYHSLAAFGSTPPAETKEFHDRWGERWCEEHLDVETCLYKAHSQILVENGIPEERIVRLPPRRGIHPSHDLLRQAKKHKCGTIVIGRRGRVDKGLLGGVSARAAKNAQNMAVWLVG